MGARVTGNGAGKIYEAASAWVDCALRADDSFFTPGNPIWTSQGLSELHNRFLDQPDAGEGSFTEKLQVQLQGSSPEVYQLMAEVLYVHLLVIWPAVMGPPAKKNLINRVLGWASGDIEMPDRMSECLSYGLARPGQGYIIFRQYQVGCLIEFVEQWKTKAREERDQLLEDPWTFKEFVMGVQLQSRLLINRQNTPKAQRQILLHLVHPDTFEGIVSADHRTLISNAEGFAHYTSEGATDIDRRIQQIRQGIEAETGADFSFYDGLIHRKWNPSKVSPWDEYSKCSPQPPLPPQPEYSVESIIDDGCFLDRVLLEKMLSQLKIKKNLILQGPPGTGKTWLAKRLAYSLIGQKDDRRVWPVQFHPNMSYEDFVRGWRPGSDGLALIDGPFLQLVEDAGAEPGKTFVMVIEEINRGNPAQIFGEALTLLEADKRRPEEGLAMSYPRTLGERVHIPPNVHVIGTMNLADRSLAMVDFALRRRFAFFDLEPTFGRVWRDWMHGEFGLDEGFLLEIERRIASLNDQIAEDRTLGPQFRVGHSYVSPAPGTSIDGREEWFIRVVESEIVPLLDEYWFDDPQAVAAAELELLKDL